MTSALLATALVLALLLVYPLLCIVQPFGRCRRCDGWGHKVSSDRDGRLKRGKPCRHCKATGKRLRLGRRIHNYAVRVHGDGTR